MAQRVTQVTAEVLSSATMLTTPTVALTGDTSVNYGDILNLTATITGGSSPTGTVSFYDGSTLLGSSTISDGVATYTASGLAQGTHLLTAVYSGDANNYPANGTLSVSVVYRMVMAQSDGGNLTDPNTWGVIAPSYGLSNGSNYNNVTGSFQASQAFYLPTCSVDGVGLHMRQIAANPVGTLTAQLTNNGVLVTGADITVNSSAIVSNGSTDGGWVYFKFSSPVSVTAGSLYRIQLKATVETPSFWQRNSTNYNWASFVKLSGTAATLTQWDTLVITGLMTGGSAKTAINVVMNNTESVDSTCSGLHISNGGSLTWSTATGSYYLRMLGAGGIQIRPGGTMTMGTTASPAPADVNYTLVMGALATLSVYAYGTINAVGQSKTCWTLLTADAAANQAVINVTDATGWQVGDYLHLPSTSTLYSDIDSSKQIQSINGNQITLSSNLTYTHTGTSPFVGEVANATRNVNFLATNGVANYANFVAYDKATVDIEYCAFNANDGLWGGNDSTTVGKRGIDFQNATVGITQTMRGCWVDFGGTGSIGSYVGVMCFATSCQGITVDGNAFYQPCTQQGGPTIIASSSTQVWNYTNNLHFKHVGSPNHMVFGMTGAGAVVQNCRFASWINANARAAFYIYTTMDCLATIDGVVVHSSGSTSNNTHGIRIQGTSSAQTVTISNCSVWNLWDYCSAYDIQGPQQLVANNCSSYYPQYYTGTSVYQSSRNINHNSNDLDCLLTFNDCVFSGGYNLLYTGFNGGSILVNFNNCTIGSPLGFAGSEWNLYYTSTTQWYVAVNGGTITPTLTRFNGTNSQYRSCMTDGACVRVNTATNPHVLYSGGTVTRDTGVFRTASPSMRLAPASATIPLHHDVAIVPIDQGESVTVTAWFRKSNAGDGAAYNGSAQPIMYAAVDGWLGWTDDQVATMTAAVGNWEQLSLTLTASNPGVVRVRASCNGTAGWVNVDDVAVSTSRHDTSAMNYWSAGQPIIAFG